MGILEPVISLQYLKIFTVIDASNKVQYSKVSTSLGPSLPR